MQWYKAVRESFYEPLTGWITEPEYAVGYQFCLAGYFNLKSRANCRRDSLHKIERRISHAGFEAGDRGLRRTRSPRLLRFRDASLDSRVENCMDKRVFWLECIVCFAKLRVTHLITMPILKPNVFHSCFCFPPFHGNKYSICA